MSKPKHYTLDLETMGVRPTSAIVAIGAAAFDYEKRIIESTFYVTIDLQSCLDKGLTVDASTIYWWLQQEEAARQALVAPQSDLMQALCHLSRWVKDTMHKDAVCWTHATFDAPILNNAFAAINLIQPTHFRKQRDIRTLVDLTDNLTVEHTERRGVAHNALDDARYQAEYIGNMLEALSLQSEKAWMYDDLAA